jgi:hypothetical protein
MHSTTHDVPGICTRNEPFILRLASHILGQEKKTSFSQLDTPFDIHILQDELYSVKIIFRKLNEKKIFFSLTPPIWLCL